MSILVSYLLKSDNSHAFFYAIVPGNEAGGATLDKKQGMRNMCLFYSSWKQKQEVRSMM